MLVRKEYWGCSRLYWELEDFESEAPEATFTFRGRQHVLKFDGCVDEFVWQNLRSANSSAVDISELNEAVSEIVKNAPHLRAGLKMEFTLTSGARWNATTRSSSRGWSVLLRSHPGQAATLYLDGNYTVRRLVLRTEGHGITHEITARPDSQGSLAAIAEAVTVYHLAS